jgi:Chaperone of endosialidase
MSQTGYTPISLYYSATASSAPIAGNLVAGELALNTNDGKLFYKDSSGVVQTLATKAATAGTYSNITVTGGSINGTIIGATTASTGAFTTLSASSTVTLSGGTANGVAYLNGSKVVTTGSALTFNGTNLSLNTGGSFVGDTYTNYGTNLVINSGGSLPMIFQLNASEQMRLNSTGLGIGTSSPAFKLDVVSQNTQFSYSGAGGTNLRLNNTSGTSSKSQISWLASGTSKFSIGVDVNAANSNNFYWYDEVAGATRMLIDSAGNLGLGATPSAWGSYKSFDVNTYTSLASSTSAFLLTANSYFNGTNYIYKATSQASFYAQSNGVHQWYNAPSGTAGNAITFTQAMTLDASGNLLVGTTTAGPDRFRVSSPGNTTNQIGLVSSDDASGNGFIQFRNSAGTSIGSIARVGTTNAVIYNTASDYRLKTVLGNVSGSGERIDALQPIDYEWKADGAVARGFLAHKFQEVYPNSVNGAKDAVDAEGNPVYQAMQTGSPEVIADLVAEIQSLRKRLAAAGI